MFTINIVLGVLKKVFGSVFSFLWEYKGWILLGVIIATLYIRGNNYRDDFKDEAAAHVKTVLTYEQTINDIKLANETALRVAQEKSAANYKTLVEKTSLIQKEYNNREKDINATITELNSVNDSLFKQIKSYTTNSNTSRSESVSDSSNARSIQKLGESLEACIGRKQFYAEDAARLNNSVITLQEWGESVVKQSKGEKDE